ncbi:amino acid adenylation domain-containing protein [Streptomyces sp. NPDC056697]|uniref:amino acid adenylation domain-containing protein n=1 Tax=Streptomyces sp. NPDC056697 TaxID=3345915 RepID=UPI003696DC15
MTGPNGETTLPQVLLDAADAAPDQVLVHVRGDGGERTVTFERLRDEALCVAGGYLAAGVAPGTCVPLLADRGADFQAMFWGALLAGLIPVPLASDVRRVVPVWESLGRPPVAVDEATETLLAELPGEVEPLRLGELRQGRPPARLPDRAPGDVAFLQFSSGSTGDPKGVELTHTCVLANLEQIRLAAALTSDDVVASWMPYFHDMGLIGTHLAPLAARAKQVRLEPLSFAKRPVLWLEMAARHRATLLSAANFALALAVRRIPDEAFSRLDLTSVRLVLVGAEPIAPAVWRRFAAQAGASGLDERAPLPVYGLAEATLAVTFPPLDEVAVPRVLDRAALSRGRALDTDLGPDAVELMDVGLPVPGCEVRIVDDAGRPLDERRVGHIRVRGPQVARGYRKAPEATAATFADGWLRTGDLGFLADGRLCVTGRHKDVVFVGGRTFHAPDLEQVAMATPGLPTPPLAVVVGSTDPADGAERVVVFVRWTRPPSAASAALAQVAARVRQALAHDDVRALPLPPGAFPRTTSGKLRRRAMRERFEAGAYAAVEERWGRGDGGSASLASAASFSAPPTSAAPPSAVPASAAPVASIPAQGGSASAIPTEDVSVSAEAAPAVPAEGVPAAGASGSGAPDADSQPVGASGPGTPGAGVPAPAIPPARDVPGGPDSRREVARVVTGIWARVLDRPVHTIGPHDGFLAIGGSSLTAMEVLAEVEDTFGVTVPPAVLRDRDTVAALTEHVVATWHGGPPEAARPRATPTPSPTPSPSGTVNDSDPGAIAVVAMACRFPGADTPDAFWDQLVAGHDAVGPVPPARWTTRPENTARWGAFLDDPSRFDATYFGMDDQEAVATDPQARIFLELAHEALERAGYAGPRRTGRRIGVFAATGESGYRELLSRASGPYGGLPPAALVGNLPNLVAARVAQSLDLTGPALAVDTACSSALVALHLARRGLQSGECDLAVVGGVNLALAPTGHRLLEQAGVLSPTGRCHAFSAAADGFVPGEGGAAIVLARLDDAYRADDRVLALLRGTAVNNDGRSLSLLAPNALTQREIIVQAYRDAGVDPDSVSYIEAHGTGTALGDPVELRSLAQAFAPRADGRPRLLGSVKTNLGHLLNAAAMPSLVKVVLALGHRQLPASLHHDPPATLPDDGAPGFTVVTEHRAWTAPGPLVAGINAFGFGGTNAHAILEQAPPPPRPPLRPRPSRRGRPETAPHLERGVIDDSGVQPGPSDGSDVEDGSRAEAGPHLLTLSARGADALAAAARDLAAHLRAHPGLDEGDVCATVNTARDHGGHRLAVVSRGDLAERLEAHSTPAVARSRPRLVFLLPGQGTARPGLGRALYRTAPEFRRVVEEASALVGPVRGRTLVQWCLDADAAPVDLARTEVSQPLLVAFGVALARQLRAWGVSPDAVAGHSVGEITAACVAGSITLGEAVRFAAERGRLMRDLAAPGAMAAVRGGDDAVAAMVAESAGALCVAAVNAPGHVVIAGAPDAVHRAVGRLVADGITARELPVSHGFHSPAIRPVADPLAAVAAELTPSQPSVPLLSTLTAQWQPSLGPAHWREHALRPVRFGVAVERLLDDGYDTFVELGPASTLPGPVRAVAAERDPSPEVLALAASGTGTGTGTGTGADPDAGQALLTALGRLWTRGVDLDHAALGAGRARVAVPTYPFQRRRHWPLHWADQRPEDRSEHRAAHGPEHRLEDQSEHRPKGRSEHGAWHRPEPVAEHQLNPAVTPLHRLTWCETPPGAGGDTPHTVRLAGPDSGLARALAHRLERRGITVRRDGDASLAELPAQLTVWLAGPAAECATVADLDTATHTVLSTLRDLLPSMSQGGSRLVAVTEDVHATGATAERPRPAQALLTGLVLALPEEFPGLTAYGVDLSSYDSLDVRLDALEREVLARNAPGGGAVAWRAGRRLVRTPVAMAADSLPSSSPLPPDGRYLITGGTGGIGTELARDLAGRGRPTLVLVGRSARPPADHLMAELGALGATAEYRVADVSVEADVEELVADLPPLDGVFHAAGVARAGTLRAKTPEEMAEVMAAKVRGSHLLSRALWRHGHRPAVCVALSSVASVLPGLAGALGDYAAANAFLDAFAASERAAGRPWQSLNFAAFAETGLAAAEPSRTAATARGVAPLTTGAGLAALHAACGIDAAQLVVAELTAVPVTAGSGSGAAVSAAAGPEFSVSVADEPRAFVSAAAESGTAVGLPATATGPLTPTTGPFANTPSAADAAPPRITGVLRRLLAEALHRAPAEVADDEQFLTMGLDSLSAVDLVRRLEAELGRPLPPTLFFEYRTIGELAAHLATTARTGAAQQPAPPSHPTADRTGGFENGAPLPLAPVQLAFHTGGRLHPGVSAYAYVRQTVNGPLDTGLLGRALALLAERHPMLRIRIEADATAPRQRVAPPEPHTMPSWYEVCHADGPLADLEEALCNRPFDLAHEAPVRAVLVRARADLAHLLLVLHHAAADGFSLNILGEELWSVYTALAHGRSPELPTLEGDFADYAAAVEAERSAPEFAEDQRYWHDTLATHPTTLDLPWDGDPEAPPAAPLSAHQVATDPHLTAALRKCAAAHGVSLFHLLLAAYARCLARWSGQRGIVVNVARARRELRLSGLDRLVGPLADTLPLSAAVDPDEPVPALAQRLRAIWLDAERHARLTSLDIARMLPTAGSRPRTASPAGFSFARFPATTDPDCPVTVRPAAARTASAATRLGLLCWESDRALHFSWNFPARLFTRTTVERLAREHLAELGHLAQLAEQAERVEHMQLATPAEGDVPAPTTVPGAVRGIVERLSARFRVAADQIAVETGDATMTYRALDRASAALADRLRARGVVPGDLVGLLTEPGADTVVGVVGILRAGAGWVPLDAAHPTARLADQLNRSTARTVVCHDATRATAETLDAVTTVAIDDPSPAPAPAPKPLRAADPTPPADPDAIAYVIFTSGSTGRPKAVPITHRAMVNYLDWAVDTFGYRSGDRLAQTASVCFDASVRQLLAPLLVGATVHTLPRNLVRDPEALLDRVVQDRITVWSSVPTLWERLLTAAETRVRRGAPRPDLSALRWIHVGGEALPAAHVRRWYDLFGPGHRIANLYGPTETTINATCHLIETRPGDEVRRLPIGRPISGAEVAVVAEDGRRCTVGEPGELLIGGTGLTPGYLGDPALTAAAFAERDGKRWYRSGDRVRQRPDGAMEFLGRLDDQVKIRGHRVEPGEIEAVLQTHPRVAHAAVLHRDGKLTGYVEPLPDGPEPDPAHLRTHLRGTLPDYMLPARFRFLAALPLTSTGKVDRRRLDESAADADTGPATDERPPTRAEAPGTAPATPTECALARIWSEVLSVAEVSREDDFFALGGDSILVLEVFARLEKAYERERRDATLPRPTVIYEHSTLTALATAVDEVAHVDVAAVADEAATVDTAVDAATPPTLPDRPVRGNPLAPASPPAPGNSPNAQAPPVLPDWPVPSGPGNPSGPGMLPLPSTPPTTGSGDTSALAGADLTPYALTPTQRGFLVAEAIAPGSGSAWLARLRLRGTLRTEVFQRAVDALVVRHPMLRTVFPAGVRPPVQQELPPALRLPVDFETLASPGLIEERVADERRRRFEPWAWPLLRLRVLTTGPDEHTLVVHAHHLIGDGYSAALFGRELIAVYDRLGRGEPTGLPLLRSTFRDYVALLQQRDLAPGPAPAATAWRARHATPYQRPDLRRPGAGSDATAGAEATGAGSSEFRSAGFTLGAESTAGLRTLATTVRATPYAPVLTAYYRALADLTGQRDLVLGLAVTGRDHPLPDISRLFGPLAAAVPLRPAVTDGSFRSFREDLLLITEEAVAARMYGTVGDTGGGMSGGGRSSISGGTHGEPSDDQPGPLDSPAPPGLPRATQFLFSYLDFSALVPPTGATLTLDWDHHDTELAPPPVGTDVFLAVRPVGDGLRVTLRASAAALDTPTFTAFTRALRDELTRAATPRPRHTPTPTPAPAPASRAFGGTDAALIGYLPAPGHLAALAGIPEPDLPRERMRDLLFPDGGPRLLEEISTPLGRSAFVAVPLFADELVAGSALTGHTARAVGHAASLGARCVSLAGMIPALTGYGFEVVRATDRATTAVTTGHAATAVSVVKTVHAALAASGRDLGDLTVAMVGLGSIGTSSLNLLLTRAPRPPAHLVLCDVEGSAPRLRALATELRGSGLAGSVATAESAPALPPAVYEADLIVTAVSAGTAVLDVDRLRPGTVVVDDSFPHCFDTARALARMRGKRDVLTVGGGLLAVGDTERHIADNLPPAAASGYAERSWLPGTVASCRLESLLHTAVSGLPLVHGLVNASHAHAYWDAVEAAGVSAAPLHLLGHTIATGPPD